MSTTIFALATPAGRSGVAIIRISGPDCGDVLRAITQRDLPAPRVATRRKFYAAKTPSAIIDDGLALWFPGPASFTGEDMAELHIHGGPAVIAAMAESLAAHGLQAAEPGAFTRRAFDNGKLDLTEVEGLADLIAAETEAQRRQALRQLEGAFGDRVEAWRGGLLGALARIEAAIDFPEEDLPGGLVEGVDEAMRAIGDEIARTLDDDHRGERLRDGLSVVILGAPNAGKSSLMNALAKRDVAIVSDEAGTTRDVIELHLDLGGYPVLLADTAGLRESGNKIETEGVRRALDRASRADLKVIVIDGAVWPVIPDAIRAQIDAASILVLNKADLLPGPLQAIAGHQPIAISALTGAGLSDLLVTLKERAAGLLASGDQPVLTRLRHREALADCRLALSRGLAVGPVELKAEELRLATRALGRITGRVEVEDVLDVIFREFCIGK
ncbi:tRNA uridine-5-carboxymethylaminomethyl(34) synthesis GTPase MnmE [Dongia sedimenti]|uniref:tRNA modification GTPase MnmE n=1 Tax=Dongia sedimenti TaxID=3064282 RepID=A0ABU0YPG2_9PROT|nr:tRNA uridine-5-carboxymethylaminomethyl(34) synthesis GTPase MnmE [Rhodospirillaceae bacterium R-7]